MSKLKQLFSSAKTAKVAVVASAVAAVSSAHAELPAVIGTTLTTVQSDGLAMADLVWPVVGAIFGAVLLFKLFKRFGNKI